MMYSVVVPVFNDALRFDKHAHLLGKWMRNKRAEVIVVDDGSTSFDSFILQNLCLENGFQYLKHERNRGKWAAVRTGALAAQGNFLVLCDADFSVPPWVTVAAYERRCISGEVMVGERLQTGIPWYRLVAGGFFNMLVRAVMRRDVFYKLRDTQAPSKVFPIGRVFFRGLYEDGFAGDVEWILAYDLSGYRVRGVDVPYVNSRESKVRLGRDSWRMLQAVFRIRKRWL